MNPLQRIVRYLIVIASGFVLATSVLLVAEGRERVTISGDNKTQAAVLPGSNFPAGATLHRKFKDREDADKFIALLSSKQTTITQLEVLDSLIREKKLELARFNEDLEKRFGIHAESDYEFDAEGGAIVQVMVVTNGSKTAGATNSVEKKLVRKMEKAEDRQDFIRMASVRNITRGEIGAFALVVGEKNLELQQCDKLLMERYGISNKSAYQYVAGELAVYELPTNSLPSANQNSALPVPK